MLYCVYMYIAISIIVVLSPKWHTLNGLRGYWVLILRCGSLQISILLWMPEWHLNTSSWVYYQWFIPSTTIKSRCYIFAVTFSFFPEWTEGRFRKWVYPFVEYCGFVESTKSTKINAELFYSLQITRSKTLCRDWKIPTFVPSCCCCFLSD